MNPARDRSSNVTLLSSAAGYWVYTFHAQVDSLLGQWGSEIMLTELDQMTIANMTAALEVVCDKLPADKDTHENRKRIAGAMIGYARSGRRTLGDFRSLGSKTLEEITRPS
jgi:hypothetical protein